VGVAVFVAFRWLGTKEIAPSSGPGRSPRLQPVTTWPTEEWEGRLSPDLQWVSFISDRGGPWSVWLRKLSGGEPAQLTHEPSDVESHVWSPDGNNIAYLTNIEGRPALRILAAPLGGRIERTIQSIRVTGARPKLVRWIDDVIYVADEGTLRRIGLAAQATEDIVSAGPGYFGEDSRFDVSVDGALTYVSSEDGKQSLWISTADGREGRPVFSDSFLVADPRWMGRNGKRIMFVSNRGGQRGLWELDLASGRLAENHAAAGLLSLGDVSADGSTISMWRRSVAASLWHLDPVLRVEKPFSSDLFGDLNPSITPDGQRIAFQRGRQDAETGVTLFDTKILVGSLAGHELLDESVVAESGYAPALSPDGRSIAFLYTNSKTGYSTELWFLELSSRRRRRVTDHVVFLGFYTNPLELAARTFAWRPHSDELWYLEEDDAGTIQLRKWGSAREAASTTGLAVGEKGQRVSHVTFDQKGRRVAFTRATPVDSLRAVVEIVSAEPEGGSLTLSRESTIVRREQVRLVGWTPGDRELLVARLRVNPDRTQDALFVAIDPVGGAQRSVAHLDRVFAQTARSLGPKGDVYLVRVEGDAANVGVLDIEAGGWTTLTSNAVPNVMFSTLTAGPGGGLFYTRQTIPQSDVWILR
jgi:Tol biopolymer transport system component